MQLTPLSVTAAIAGLFKVGDEILATHNAVVEPLWEGPGSLEWVRLEVRNVLIVLRQLQRALAELGAISPERRALVEVRYLVAIIGEGVLEFDRLVTVLGQPVPEELVGSRLALQSFRTSIWLLLGIFQSVLDVDLIDSLDGLRVAVGSISHDDGKIARRLKGAHLLTEHLANRTLLEVSDLSVVAIPLGSKDLVVTGSHYGFGLASIAQTNRPISSCDVVFRLPRVTNAVILQLFRHAVKVSQRFANSDMAVAATTNRQVRAIEKLQRLTDKQVKDLCVDVYDELVRRNVADKKKAEQLAGCAVTMMDPPVMIESFSDPRNRARVKLAAIDDARFLTLLADVCAELERRCQGLRKGPGGNVISIAY